MTAYLNIWRGPALVATIPIKRYCAAADQLVYDIQYDQLPVLENPQHQNQRKSPTERLLLDEVRNAEDSLQTIRELLNHANPTMSKYIIDRLAVLFAATAPTNDPTAVG